MYFILDVLCLIEPTFEKSLICVLVGLGTQTLFGNVGKLILSY